MQSSRILLKEKVPLQSTLFNLILGEESPDAGTISWERGADFGFLPQESAPAGDESILHDELHKSQRRAGECEYRSKSNADGVHHQRTRHEFSIVEFSEFLCSTRHSDQASS